MLPSGLIKARVKVEVEIRDEVGRWGERVKQLLGQKSTSFGGWKQWIKVGESREREIDIAFFDPAKKGQMLFGVWVRVTDDEGNYEVLIQQIRKSCLATLKITTPSIGLYTNVNH